MRCIGMVTVRPARSSNHKRWLFLYYDRIQPVVSEAQFAVPISIYACFFFRWPGIFILNRAILDGTASFSP